MASRSSHGRRRSCCLAANLSAFHGLGPFIERRFAHGHRFGVAAAQVFGQVHAIVGAQRLVAKDVDAIALEGATRDQLLDAMVADHAVADNDKRLLRLGGGHEISPKA